MSSLNQIHHPQAPVKGRPSQPINSPIQSSLSAFFKGAIGLSLAGTIALSGCRINEDDCNKNPELGECYPGNKDNTGGTGGAGENGGGGAGGTGGFGGEVMGGGGMGGAGGMETGGAGGSKPVECPPALVTGSSPNVKVDGPYGVYYINGDPFKKNGVHVQNGAVSPNSPENIKNLPSDWYVIEGSKTNPVTSRLEDGVTLGDWSCYAVPVADLASCDTTKVDCFSKVATSAVCTGAIELPDCTMQPSAEYVMVSYRKTQP